MLGKTQVYEYLDKLQAEMIAAVNKDFDTQLEAAIDAFLDDPENAELTGAINRYNFHAKELKEATATIERLTGKGINCITSDVLKNLFKCWNPISAETVNVVQADRNIMIDKVKAEYAKTRAIVKSKRNGQAAKEALIALGFDVAYLDKQENLPVVINPKEITVDKSLLFPCKENFV